LLDARPPGMAYYEPSYGQNYAAEQARGPVPATAVAPQPSVFPHMKRVVAFERTPLEAWQEYQDELTRIVNQRHALVIQARTRGMLGRKQTVRVRLQSERVVLIQRMVRDKLARREAQRQIRRLKIASLMAKGERKAVMKLQAAFLRRRERKRTAAASIMQAHFIGLKVRPPGGVRCGGGRVRARARDAMRCPRAHAARSPLSGRSPTARAPRARAAVALAADAPSRARRRASRRRRR
jgi:hypothetical protein